MVSGSRRDSVGGGSTRNFRLMGPFTFLGPPRPPLDRPLQEAMRAMSELSEPINRNVTAVQLQGPTQVTTVKQVMALSKKSEAACAFKIPSQHG